MNCADSKQFGIAFDYVLAHKKTGANRIMKIMTRMNTIKNTNTSASHTRTALYATTVKTLCLLAAVSLSLLTQAQDWNQIIKQATPATEGQSSDREMDDNFGWSSAISGDYAIVGAYQEDHDATGLSSLSGAGSAYIMKQTAGTWSVQEKLVASDRAAGDQFGYSVAISGDYAIVAAGGEDEDANGNNTLGAAGSVYIFKQTAGVWSQQQKIVPSDRAANDNFGYSIAIDGDYLIVGARFEADDEIGMNPLSSSGSAYIFKQTAGVWSQQQKIVASDREGGDQFGSTVSISGDYAVVGAAGEDENASGLDSFRNSGSAYIYKQTAGVWNEQQKIVASDRAKDDNFSTSLAISGDYIIAGAAYESEDANGNNTLGAAGSAYIFKQTAGVWSQQQKIVASDRAGSDFYGIRASINGDYAVVGAYGEAHDVNGNNQFSYSGSAYIYKQTAGVWSEQQKIVASDRASSDFFGISVSVSGDYVIVGSYAEDHDANGNNMISGAGSAYIYKQTAGVWSEQQKIVAGRTLSSDRAVDDQFGYTVAISGDYAVVGAPYEDEDAAGANTFTDAGAAYIFKNTAGVWNRLQKIVPSDRAASDNFGHSVSISGDYVIVGAILEDEDGSGGAPLTDAGSAYIFLNTADVWSEQQKIVPADREAGDQFGYSVSIDGDHAVVSAIFEDHDAAGSNILDASGSAYTFVRSGTNWTQQDKIVAADRGANDEFGYSVAISGDYAIIGARYEDEDAGLGNTLSDAGSAYIFKQTAGSWSQQQKLVNSDRAIGDKFGWSVAIDGDYAIVGAPLEDEDTAGAATAVDAGSVYAFKQTAGTWDQQQKIVAADRSSGDQFGHSVSISGSNAMVGANYEAEDASGGNTLATAGSAYVFKGTDSSWYQINKLVASDRVSGDEFGYAVAISGDYALAGAYHHDEDANGANTLSNAGSIYIMEATHCTSSSPVALARSTTYTASFTESVSGWTNFCTENGEILLSLDTAGSGAVIDATQVQVKTGTMNTYSYGAAGGLITNVNGYVLMDRLWDVSPTTQPSTGDVGVRFYFSDAEYDSVVAVASRHVNSMAVASPTAITAPTNLEFYKATTGAAFSYPHTVMGELMFDSSAASVNKWTYAAAGSDHRAEFKVSSFSGGGGGAGAGDASLPVTLLDFHGEWLNASVANLSWRTATESNNSHFELERSTDGQHWEHIARLESKAPNGTTHQIVNYAQLDTDVPATQPYFYYRLVQHDFDGTIAIHDPIVLRREQGGIRSILDAIVLYPNPFRGELTVVHAVEDDDVQIEISDALGRVVYAADRIVHQQTIALDHLPAGLYHATISSASARRVHKIIKH